MPEECSPPPPCVSFQRLGWQVEKWVLVWGRNDGAESCKVLTGTCMLEVVFQVTKWRMNDEK